MSYWLDFWHTFWNFGHATAELAWEIISTGITFFIAKAYVRRHDAKHHNHTDHSGDSK
jgi:hypothetical protein